MKTRFGGDRLFKDVDSIPLGKDFRTVISETVEQCQVLLAVIGKDWLNTTDDAGKRRIDDPNDYVHIEIAAALNRGIPVIPILVENTTMPRSDDLPDPLKNLAFRNGTPVRSDPDFHHDIDRLCSQLAEYLPNNQTTGLPWAQGIKGGKFKAWVGILAVLLLLVIGYFQFIRTASVSETADLSKQATSLAPVPIRFWIKQLPEVPGEEATKLFNNALGSWQAVVATPIRKADSEGEANVIIFTSPDTIADAQVGPPTTEKSRLIIRFGSVQPWTQRTFEAASCRMLGHILGLTSTNTPGQIMSENAKLESLPLTPQLEDIKRIREIWNK